MKTNEKLQERLKKAIAEIYQFPEQYKFECYCMNVPEIYWYSEELLDIDIIMQVTGDHNPSIYIAEDEEHGKYFEIVVCDMNEELEIPF